MKRTLSLILSMLMVLSLFTGLNVGAGARVSDLAETGAAYKLWLGSIQVTDTNKDDILRDGGKAKYDPATHTLTLNDPDIPDVCVDDYTGVGGTTGQRSFKIYTDGIPLTIKGSYHMPEPVQDYNILIAYGVFINNSAGKSAGLTLDGDFTFYGIGSGDALYIDDGDLNIKSGNVKFYGKEGITVGINCGGEGNINIDDNVESVTAEGGYAAIGYFNELNIGDSLAITEPGGAVIKRSETTNNNYVYEPNAQYISRYVVIEKKENVKYNLWLGETQVTCNNLNDILGDGGKAKYDPATHTLTLNDPVIPGVYKSSKIYSYCLPLIVNGSYHMTGAESTYGIYFDDSDITVNGDFTVYGNAYGIFSPYSDITLNGNVTSYGNKSGIEIMGNDLNINGGAAEFKSSGQSGYGIRLYGGALNISGSVESITAEGTVAAVRAEEINITNTGNQDVRIIEPAGGMINHSDDEYNNYYIYEADGETIAKRVVIGNKEHLKYNIWLGGTQVTYKNRNDILGDGGKATFDPESKTLTLNEPVISGVYERSGETNGEPWTNSCKIYSYGIPLAVKGSYHMNEAESDYAIYGDHSDLTFNGDFTVCGNAAGIYGNNSPITLYGTATANGGNYGICGDHSDITINGDLTAFGEASGIDGYYADININGNVTSKGGTNGISGTGCDLNIDGGSAYFSGHNYGIILGGTLNISGNAWSVTADSYLFFAVRTTKGININNSGDQNVRVIEPDGGIIKKSDSSNYYYVYESDGTTIANHALFSSHTPISAADCEVIEPVGGQQPDKTAVSGDSDKYTVTVVNWFKGSGDDAVLMTSRERFIAGETYSVRVRYTALDSYTFTGETNYTVNGKSTTYLGRNTYEATFTATVPPQPILAADRVVTEPIAGQTPNKTAVSGDSGKYFVEVINWYKGSGDSAELMPSRATFTAGETYSVRVRYTALDGYYLTTVTEYTINGESPTYLGRGVYEATFTAINPAQPKPIAAISCTVTEPIAGQKPDYTAVPADSTKYTATVSSWIKGTGRTARTMSADETFIAGETYQVQVKFTVMTGYTSTDDTVYTINGKTPTKITGREIYYSITFTNTPTAFLGDVDFDGNIEIRDATWIQRSAADIEIPFVIKKLSADVDGDNNITVMDATLIQYYLANMKNPYNIGKTL